MLKRIAKSIIGFIAGIVSIPLIVIVWPFTVAVFIYNELDEDYQ